MTEKQEVVNLPVIDVEALEGEAATLVWVALDYAEALRWRENPKAHDIGAQIESFRQYGMRDNPAFDSTLENVQGSRGAIVYGNGRIEALVMMHAQGMDRPRGIKADRESGMWYVPIMVGLDAQDAFQAAAFGIDHNATTLSGGDLGLNAHAAIFDSEKLMALLGDVQAAGRGSVVFDDADLQSMLATASGVFQEPPAPSAPPPYDATKLDDATPGGDVKTTWIIYVTLSDVDQFNRALTALSYHERHEQREGVFYATIDGGQWLARWEEDLTNGLE